MTKEQIAAIAADQRRYFATGATLPVEHRIAALKKLRQLLLDNEAAIAEALHSDLGKSPMEGYMCETGLVVSEISYLLRHVRRFAREKTVATPIAQFDSRILLQDELPQKVLWEFYFSENAAFSTVFCVLTL